MEPKTDVAKELQLPLQIIGKMDVARIIRELEGLEDWLTQSAIRKSEEGAVLPRTSRLLEEFAAFNHLNFLKTEDRQSAQKFLKGILESAPVIHISFASDPSAAFTNKIIAWLRNNIDPQILLNVGLEPSIAAGCVIRSGNRQFDGSLRQSFAAQRQLLSYLITGKSEAS